MTAAGLVFAFTMMSMAASAMVVIAQIGTTTGLGLLFEPAPSRHRATGSRSHATM